MPFPGCLWAVCCRASCYRSLCSSSAFWESKSRHLPLHLLSLRLLYQKVVQPEISLGPGRSAHHGAVAQAERFSPKFQTHRKQWLLTAEFCPNAGRASPVSEVGKSLSPPNKSFVIFTGFCLETESPLPIPARNPWL